MGGLPELTIGICAYNEEKNVGKLLEQLLTHSPGNGTIKEILVISSGSTDATEKTVRRFAKRDARIRLLTEAERQGKVSAVNLILQNASADIVVLCGADLQLDDDTMEKLIEPFSEPSVGMVGGRPVPANDQNSFMGFSAHLLWRLHHWVALRSPKCGELIAVRNKGYSIPSGVPVDEAYLESCCISDGMRLAYAPDAIVHNRGPETAGDYLKQRRRIHVHHFCLQRNAHYSVSTGKLDILLPALLANLSLHPKSLAFTMGTLSLELFSFLLAIYDFHIKGHDHLVWDTAKSTKVVRA